jgi:hypothetical protein
MRLHHLSDELVAKTTEDLLELVNLRKLLNQYFSKVEISKVLKSEPGNLSISYALTPTMNTSSEVLVDKVISHLTNNNTAMLDTPYSTTYEKIDDHHFLIKLHNSSVSELHKDDPHTHKDEETKEELLLPKADVLVDVQDLNINTLDDTTDDDYLMNKSMLNDSTENSENQLVSEYSYARTLKDLFTNYKMISPNTADEYLNYTSAEESSVSPERFVLYKNKAGVAIMIKDLETDKYWELDR